MPRSRDEAFGRALGRVIKTARRKTGMKAHDLADRIGITPQAMSQWETGKVLPNLSNLRTAALVLGLPLSRMFEFAERLSAMGNSMASDAKRISERNMTHANTEGTVDGPPV
jgi:transcriptional regulator with XRE-family HTH domain